MNEQEHNKNEEEYFITYLSFTIRDKTSCLNPESVTEALGIQPSWSYKRGEKYSSKRPADSRGQTAVERQRPFTVWGLRTDSVLESDELDRHCQTLLEWLEPQKTILEQYLGQPESYYIEISIWTEHSDWIISYGLDSDLLIRLSKLCHGIGFSNICYGDDDPSSNMVGHK